MLLKIREVKDDVGNIISVISEELKYIRIQPNNRARQNAQGEQFFAKWRIFFNPDIDIIETDKFELDGKQYSILELYRAMDRNNNHHHTEVTL